MDRAELKAAIQWGNELIAEYAKQNREVPLFAYERQVQLYEQLVAELEKVIE